LFFFLEITSVKNHKVGDKAGLTIGTEARVPCLEDLGVAETMDAALGI